MKTSMKILETDCSMFKEHTYMTITIWCHSPALVSNSIVFTHEMWLLWVNLIDFAWWSKLQFECFGLCLQE